MLSGVRREDQRLVTGYGRYVADHDAPGQLHAAFRRADRGHAIIRSIDTSAAEQMPGVIAIYTAATLGDGFRNLPPAMPFQPRPGTQFLVPDRMPLAHDRVRFVGEEVALVIAETRHQAIDAAEMIEVDFDELPAVNDVDAAIAPGAPQLHDAIAANIAFDFEYGDAAATDAAFARAAHVVKLEVDSPRVAPTPMEPRAFLTWFDDATGCYEVRCANQGTPGLRDGLAVMTGIEATRIRVPMVDVGGGFGARTAPFHEYPALMRAAKLLGRPVKWVGSRGEDFLTDAHGRAIRLTGELALDENGRFLALRNFWRCDSGAYLSSAGAMTNSSNGLTMGAGCYVVEALYARHVQVLTNAPPTSPYRGAGRPEAALIIERLVDEAAVLLGLDPLELRRRNAIRREAMPYTTLTKTVFESGDFPALLEKAEAASDWAGFAARREASTRAGKLRGIGAALFLEPSGGGHGPDQTAIEFAPDGTARLYMVAAASGQGHETVFPMMIAQWLGLDDEKIILRAGDPDGPALKGAPAVGSRTTMTQGSSFRRAADEVIRKGLDLAADALETSPGDIEFRDGAYFVRGTDRSVLLSELVIRHAPASGPHPLDSRGEAPPNRAFPSGAHIAEVEIDIETGATELLTYTAVDDVGVLIHPTLAKGQLVGGVIQGAGQVFGEQMLYDPSNGQPLTASFMDYTMPRADLIGEFRVIDSSVPSTNNLLGVKGAGEAGTTGAGPTLLNAVMNALRSAGVRDFQMPVTPSRIWNALQARAAE